MPRLLPLKGLTRGGVRPRWRGLGRPGPGRPGRGRRVPAWWGQTWRERWWHAPAAVFTSMTALAATSLVTGPSVAVPLSMPCALKRTEAHHSEGLDTWNAAYPRPTRRLDAVMVFLSFPDADPLTTPDELTADYFPATSRFFERASYGRFQLRPHPLTEWIRMPRASTSYAIQRDWNAAARSAYLRDALAAADDRVDFSRYDIVYFVADPDAPGVDSDATKVVNMDTPLRADGKDIRRVVTVFEKHPPDRLVLAHETGHVFDLPDLYHRPADGKGDWDTYVGDWDLMGSQFGLAPDLFGWHKWKLGWLETRQVACAGRGRTGYAADTGVSGGGARGGRGGFGGLREGGCSRCRAGVARHGIRVRERDETGGGADRAGQRGRLRGARAGRQRRVGLLTGSARLPHPRRDPVRRWPDRGRRRAPLVRGLLGRLGLSAARRRAGRPR